MPVTAEYNDMDERLTAIHTANIDAGGLFDSAFSFSSFEYDGQAIR
jgi:hypothetical protein